MYGVNVKGKIDEINDNYDQGSGRLDMEKDETNTVNPGRKNIITPIN